MARTTQIALGLILAAALAAHPALAQSEPPNPMPKQGDEAKDPKKQPAPPPADAPPPAATPPAKPADDIIKDMEKSAPKRQAPGSTGGVPDSAAKPGNTEKSSVPQPSAGKLLREGTFLVSRRGRVVRGSAGDWVYVFDTDAQGKADPAMTLMPCQNLAAMEKIAERSGDGTSFSISGQVFVYKGRNYLLPSAFMVNRKSDVTPAQ